MRKVNYFLAFVRAGGEAFCILIENPNDCCRKKIQCDRMMISTEFLITGSRFAEVNPIECVRRWWYPFGIASVTLMRLRLTLVGAVGRIAVGAKWRAGSRVSWQRMACPAVAPFGR